ncbi:MAG: VCBS repeat-containing protein, partial [Desulfobacterales bacterium]|nr:VCBS repeat-containing protein [Desulfobacterales bacterium]
MSISYTKDQGEIYLSRIDYTGNSKTGMGTTHAVTFDLESRSDAWTRYTLKFPVATAQRLARIHVWSRNESGTEVLVRKYELTYDADLDTPAEDYSPLTGRSLLGSVQQFGKDGGGLPPVKCFYQKGSKSFHDFGDAWYDGVGGDFGNWSGDLDLVYSMDVNGDRKADIVAGPDGNGQFRWLKSTGDVFVYGGELITDGITGSIMVYFRNNRNRTYPMDVNGDGKTDIVAGPDGNGQFYWLRAGEDAGGNVRLFNEGVLNDGTKFSTTDYDMRNIRPMDINGDGRMDLVAGPKLVKYPMTLVSTIYYTVLKTRELPDGYEFDVTNYEELNYEIQETVDVDGEIIHIFVDNT